MTTRQHGYTYDALKRNNPERFQQSVRNGGLAKKGKTKGSEPPRWMECDADEFIKWLLQREEERNG